MICTYYTYYKSEMKEYLEVWNDTLNDWELQNLKVNF